MNAWAEQVAALNEHLQRAREDERARLARELHDELGALLTSAKLDIARLRIRLVGLDPGAMERLSHLNDTVNDIIALKRRIVEDLRPSALAHLGLLPSLEILAREFSEETGLQLHAQLASVPLPPDLDLVIYRLVQEALTNIRKHARARQVWLTLAPTDTEPPQLEVSVQDDGVGFDTSARRGSAYGLLGMRLRVEAERGCIRVESSPDQGTRVVARLPLSAREPQLQGLPG
jgi:signal transduction histidine kinase